MATKIISEVTLQKLLQLIASEINKKANETHIHSQYATLDYVNNQISAINSFDIQVVEQLPTENISTHTIYFLKDNADINNLCHEYMYVNNAWERIGDTAIDLSDYPTTDEMNGAIAEMVADSIGDLATLDSSISGDTVVAVFNKILTKINAISLDSLTKNGYVASLPDLTSNETIATQSFVNDAIANAVTGGQIDLSDYVKKGEFTTELAKKADVSHTHAISEVTGLQSALDGKSDTTHKHDSDYASITHTHEISEVNGLQTELDKKADTTTVNNALSGKSDTGHKHVISDITDITISTEADATTMWNTARANANI